MGKTLRDYLIETAQSSKRIQIINGNHDVLYYGKRGDAMDYLDTIIVKVENILNAVDCITIEYDT